MVAFSSGSLMRAEWCWGPSARAFVLAFALGHLRMAEALPLVAKTSPSRAYAGLPRVVDFMGGNRASPRSTMLDAVDAHEILGDKVPSNRLCVLTPLDRDRSFARVLSLQVVDKVASSGGLHISAGPFPFRRASAVSPIIIVPATFWEFPGGGVPRNDWPSEFYRSTDSAHDEPSLDPTVLPFARRAAMYTFAVLAPLPVGIKVLAIAMSNFYTVDAVCPHCKDTILPAGHLAAACPLVVELTKNAEIFEKKKLGSSPTVAHSMTHELAMQFTRPVVDAIVGLACAPVQGVQIDFTDPMYNAASAVVKAAVYGHCSFAEASAILAERLDAAANIEAIEKIRGAMDSLKTAGETAVHSATGTFLFVWAKVSNVISKRADFTYKLEAAAKSKSAVHSVTLVRPETEAEFYEMTHLFIMTVIALGLASATIVIKFIDDVVFGTVRMREPFTVAHELVICYFREMDFDPARLLHMGNVFRRGGQDTLLSEARRNAAAFFRVGGGNLQPKGNNDDKLGNIKTVKTIKPNGKSDESSKKPCPDFNGGRPCKHLKPDGTCTLAHKCNQFVSDKGPGGYCMGPHARCTHHTPR